MKITRSISIALTLLFALAQTGCDDDDDGGISATSLRVINNSDFAIIELYLTDVGSPTWGRNLLGDDPLLPDEQLLLGVSCGLYDALLIDEEGVDCEIPSIDLCLNDAVWLIENDTCTVFEATTGRVLTPAAKPDLPVLRDRSAT